MKFFGTPGPTTLDKGSLSLTRSLDVPRISRYDVDTETPRPEKLGVDFDTTVNSSPTDISGRGNHGTLVGATYSSADKAFVFDGNGDYIEGIVGGSLQTHTVSAWINFDSAAQWEIVYSIGTAVNGRDNFNLYVGNNLFRLESVLGTNGPYHDFAYTFTNNKWVHLVLIFRNTGLEDCEMYIDNVKLSVTGTGRSIGDTITFTSSPIFRIGRSYNTAYWLDGKISNFKLYNVALEPSEVKKLYNLGRTGRSMVISDTAVGIGKVPEAQLDVRGNLNVDGVITNQQRPAFYVWRDGTGNSVELKNTTGVITNWDSKRIDTAGTFDLSNGRYYIPVSGLYNFVGSGLYRYNGSGNGILEVSFYVNGSNVTVRGISYNRGNTVAEHHTVTITFMRFMNAGDYVQMGLHDVQTACDLYYGDGLGYFSGYLLG